MFTSQTCSIVADRTKAYAICPHSLLLAEAAHLKATYPDFKLGEFLSFYLSFRFISFGLHWLGELLFFCYSWGLHVWWGLHVGGSGGATGEGGVAIRGQGW